MTNRSIEIENGCSWAVSAIMLLTSFALGGLAPLEGAAFAAGSSIQFSNRSINFGSVKRGRELVHKFKFTNKGDASLKIKAVYASCGCTVINFEQNKMYAPKEDGEIIVTFRTEGFIGAVSKTVSVMTNERKRGNKVLTLRANIVEEFSVSRPVLDFGEVRPESSARQQVRLKPRLLDNFKVLDAIYDPKIFNVTYTNQKGVWLIDVHLKSGQPSGYLKETILIKNSSESLPSLTVPVRANVVGNFRYSPEYIEFGSVAQGGKVEKAINLVGERAASISGSQWRLFLNGSIVKEQDRYLSVSYSAEMEPNRTSKIVVRLTNVSDTQGSVHGYVVLETDDQFQKEIRVPFFGFLR